MTNNLGGTRPYLFSGTTYIFDNPGTFEYYKFTVNGGFSGLGWESPASADTLNRSFTLPASATNLPIVSWSDWIASDVLSADTAVTFQVSMTNAVGSDGHVFNPNNGDNVYLNGDWIPWWIWGLDVSQIPQFQMINNPVGSGVYSLSLTFPKGYSVPITYKYSINGLDDEAAFATNHLRYIRAVGNYALPLDTFGNQLHETLQPPGLPQFTGISVSGTTLTLNAANGTPGGQYTLLGSTNLALNLWTTVLTGTFDSGGSLNLIVTNLINPAAPQQFYMLRQ